MLSFYCYRYRLLYINAFTFNLYNVDYWGVCVRAYTDAVIHNISHTKIAQRMKNPKWRVSLHFVHFLFELVSCRTNLVSLALGLEHKAEMMTHVIMYVIAYYTSWKNFTFNLVTCMHSIGCPKKKSTDAAAYWFFPNRKTFSFHCKLVI